MPAQPRTRNDRADSHRAASHQPGYHRQIAGRNAEAILDAAEELLRKEGHASISAVAAWAGVSRVTVYAHYPAWRRCWRQRCSGVLAGHSPVRPNHLGVSCCELLTADGLTLTVKGLDAIDGTPVLDIKPYATGFQPTGLVREPAWIGELMRDYY